MGRKLKIGVIGSGFAGLTSAAYLAKEGYDVHVFEKNSTIGGRARQFADAGFVFDMGPSWYWMPDVFERFFNDFGYSSNDFYKLKKLSPAFDVVFKNNKVVSIPNNTPDMREVFESVENGAGISLDIFLSDAKIKYEESMSGLIDAPSISPFEFINLKTIRKAKNLNLLSSFRKHVNNHFKHPHLRSIMEFPVLFLGAEPTKIPALYSLMNYAGFELGTWYPEGGFNVVAEAISKVGKDLGVTFHTSSEVNSISIEDGKATALIVNNEEHRFDGVIGAGDYEHIESKLLPKTHANYKSKYWKTKTFAPSCLIFYLGISNKIKNINHHTLFFDEDMDLHADEIYNNKKWPTAPLFYVCAPSVSDKTVAPEGKENLFILMPLATGIEDNNETREHYFNILLKRIEKQFNQDISSNIEVKHSYCINDFIKDYNAFEGNAYGLANTLTQTAFLKPKIINKKVKNLVYAGQLTVPGPGVPPSLISGRIAANLLSKKIKQTRYETAI